MSYCVSEDMPILNHQFKIMDDWGRFGKYRGNNSPVPLVLEIVNQVIKHNKTEN